MKLTKTKLRQIHKRLAAVLQQSSINGEYVYPQIKFGSSLYMGHNPLSATINQGDSTAAAEYIHSKLHKKHILSVLINKTDYMEDPDYIKIVEEVLALHEDEFQGTVVFAPASRIYGERRIANYNTSDLIKYVMHAAFFASGDPAVAKYIKSIKKRNEIQEIHDIVNRSITEMEFGREPLISGEQLYMVLVENGIDL